MEYQEKILLLVTGLLIVLALYFTFTATTTKAANIDTKTAEALLMKGLRFGANQTDYFYSYTDLSDGYKTTYMLTKRGNESLIEIQNPLSDKKAYFLANDTVLCIKYSGNDTCSSVQNETDLNNYLNSLRAKFFNDTNIEKNKNGIVYLIKNKYLYFSPDLKNKTVRGNACEEVSYTINYSNLSVSDAAAFGIGTTSPKVFHLTICVDNESGYLYEKTLNYTYNQLTHMDTFTLLSFKPGTPGTIIPPSNLSEGALKELLKEKEQQIKLANCYTTKQGDELDRCIAIIALDIHRKDLCDLTGERRDRCLVSLVPITKDETICTTISQIFYRDDCYIELAGAYKNNTYCADIQNVSKVDFCMNIATSTPPSTPDNQTTNSSTNITGFMNYIDNANDTPESSNITNSSSG